jgi:hypothetical protein
MPEASVVCARSPFLPGSDAVIALLTQASGIPDDVKAQGFSYFLEAHEIGELLEMISRKRASRDTKAEFVRHYAEHDAYPSWFYDLPDL